MFNLNFRLLSIGTCNVWGSSEPIKFEISWNKLVRSCPFRILTHIELPSGASRAQFSGNLSTYCSDTLNISQIFGHSSK